jgi:hypothetical protein
MKLYTEDEVRRIIKIAFWQDFENGTTEEDIIAKAHSINLPSDDEIDKATPFDTKTSYHLGFMYGFEDGAKWVINHIKQQDIKQEDNEN